MIWIKICGTTNLEDAQVAVEAGADALGFIFAPSPRRISPRDAAKIIRELPRQVEKIGVFVNQKAQIIYQTVEEAALTGVQLHGDEDADFIAALWADMPRRLRLLKAIRVREGFEAELAEFEKANVDAFLLDSGTAAQRGGTGKTFGWDEAAPLMRLAARKFRIVAAGGLRPENVAEAVQRFGPFGVDVVSGVESEPGRKDRARVKMFVAAAREAETIQNSKFKLQD